MILIKITILFTVIMLMWCLYVTGLLRNNMEFNAQINIHKNYPKWYKAFCLLVALDLLLILISLTYFLFWIWR